MKPLIKREISGELEKLSKEYPAVVITGPRQSGKTTLAKMTFPRLPYFSLEDPDLKELALSDPRAFLKNLSKGAILDEIQNVPLLLSYLQGMIDNGKKGAKFILTGSQQFELMHKISQSLAGRAAMLRLLPFTISEVKKIRKDPSLSNYLLEGFYPRIHTQKQTAFKAYRNYLEAYVQRDLRQMINIRDLMLFKKFVRLCAGRVGQIFVASNIANELGVSVSTVTSWLSILEAAYIIFLLEPYYENIGKRLIKSPKLYFYDTGLACSLLGIENKTQLGRDPLYGSLVENLAILELLKHQYNRGLDNNLYFFRDSNGNEVDILLKAGRNFTAFEVKSASTYNKSFTKNLHYIKKLLKERIKKSFIAYTGEAEQKMSGISLINIENIAAAA